MTLTPDKVLQDYETFRRRARIERMQSRTGIWLIVGSIIGLIWLGLKLIPTLSSWLLT